MNDAMIEKVFGVVDGWVERALDAADRGVTALERIATAQEEIAANDPLKKLDAILGATTSPDYRADPQGADPTDPFGGRDPFEVAGS